MEKKMTSLPSVATSPAIQVRGLSKVYTVHEREPGTKEAIKSLFRRRYKDIRAVDDISFDVAPGEIVGFLGPNGAGKTTTIKMLAGLLHPSQGEARVLGHVPFERDKSLLMQITLAMGRRNQLLWDVPAIESFEFFKAIYDVPQERYAEILKELTDLMDLAPLLKKPVRNLSLGERMKCELAAALLHRPRLLLLDEPTASLDADSARRAIELILELKAAGTAMIGVFHDRLALERLADSRLELAVAEGVPQ
jgi:ABC-2 type transport system ATP-binding protein